MANRISIVLAALEHGLQELVDKGLLRALKRDFISPLTEQNVPILGLVVDDFGRESGPTGAPVWRCEVLLPLLLSRGGDEALDEQVIDLVAEVDACVQAVADSDAPGGTIDTPRWTPWYSAKGGALARVGAVGSIRIRIAGALKA